MGKLKEIQIKFTPMYKRDKEWFYRIATQSDGSAFWYGPMYGDVAPDREAFFADWMDTYFRDQDPESGRCYALEADEKRIGVISYGPLNQDDGSVGIDIIIGDEEDMGKGAGSTALRRFAEYLCIILPLQFCWTEALKSNTRAVKAYRKAGFTQISTHKRAGREWVRFERRCKFS